MSDALATCSHKSPRSNLPLAPVPRHLTSKSQMPRRRPSPPPLSTPPPTPHPHPDSHPPAPLLPLHRNPNPIHSPHGGQTLLTRPDTLLAQLTRRYGGGVDAGTLLVGGQFLWDYITIATNSALKTRPRLRTHAPPNPPDHRIVVLEIPADECAVVGAECRERGADDHGWGVELSVEGAEAD
ncbi:hypothetical protein ABVK25_006086 [Lepraria finkii]|uniref:Uncharacterized protein n=1 Tax=Lepraria finkii TaxID=1340010 RepID=A0ABR4B9P2_9LECA